MGQPTVSEKIRCPSRPVVRTDMNFVSSTIVFAALIRTTLLNIATRHSATM